MKKFLFTSFLLAGLSLAARSQAETVAKTEPVPVAPANSSLEISGGALTIGYLSPAFGSVMLGVSPDNAAIAAPALSTPPVLSSDFSATYKTQLRGGQFGLSAGFTNGGSLFTAAPTSGWNLGASVGYAGFYLHAGISDAAQARLVNDPSKGWLAGFGYQTGGLNVRLSYMTAQTPLIGDNDSRTWMIGGIYQLSTRLRVNADAFTGHDTRPLNATPATPSTATAPQGTGARVGVQLRF